MLTMVRPRHVGMVAAMDTDNRLPRAVMDQIRAEMAIRRITVTSLAKQLGVARSTANAWFNGTTFMPLDMLIRAADILESDPTVIFDRAYDRLRTDQSRGDNIIPLRGAVWDDDAYLQQAARHGDDTLKQDDVT